MKTILTLMVILMIPMSNALADYEVHLTDAKCVSCHVPSEIGAITFSPSDAISSISMGPPSFMVISNESYKDSSVAELLTSADMGKLFAVFNEVNLDPRRM